MGNRIRSCIYNTLMHYHSGMLAIAFTASAPRELFQEELGVTAGAVGHPSSGKMKVFPGPSTCFIISHCPPGYIQLCLKELFVCSFKRAASPIHEIKI